MSNYRRGKVCLYWCSALNDTELTVGRGNRIDIEVTPLSAGLETRDPALYARYDDPDTRPSPDERSKYRSIRIGGGRFDSRNPNPFAENTLRPDTGYSGTMVRMYLFFLEEDRIVSADNENSKRAYGISRIRDWSRQDNTVRGLFRNGRIGLRNDYRPEFNVRPDNFGGYKIAHFDLDSESRINYHTRMELILQYSGAPGTTNETGDTVTIPRLGNTHRETEQVA